MNTQQLSDEELRAYLDEIRRKVDEAFVGTTGYDDSVTRLEKIGFSTDDAMGIAARHHGLVDDDDDPNWVPATDASDPS